MLNFKLSCTVQRTVTYVIYNQFIQPSITKKKGEKTGKKEKTGAPPDAAGSNRNVYADPEENHIRELSYHIMKLNVSSMPE